MALKLVDLEKRTGAAVSHYWRTLEDQGNKQREKAGDSADRGNRAAVTAGKQMAGFCKLVAEILQENGLPTATIHLDTKLDLPGYFRASKTWDMLIVHDGKLVSALEFKSQRGPSFGNNFNNRTEEAIGTAVDLWTAFREGAFGRGAPRPWLGWLMLLEDCDASRTAVRAKESHFEIFPEFRGASYAKRYELLLRRLMLERLYDGACFLTATESGARRGNYKEPASDLSVRRFFGAAIGHVSGQVGGRS